MAGLARDLKLQLFDRTPRGMRLTVAAELLVTHVDAVFSRLNDAQGDRFPRVDVSLADGAPYESVARLKERELDLAAVFDFDRWALSADFDGQSSARTQRSSASTSSTTRSTSCSLATTRSRSASGSRSAIWRVSASSAAPPGAPRGDVPPGVLPAGGL